MSKTYVPFGSKVLEIKWKQNLNKQKKWERNGNENCNLKTKKFKWKSSVTGRSRLQKIIYRYIEKFWEIVKHAPPKNQKNILFFFLLFFIALSCLIGKKMQHQDLCASKNQMCFGPSSSIYLPVQVGTSS